MLAGTNQTEVKEPPTATADVATRLSTQVQQLILRRIAGDALPLPTRPTIATNCLNALNATDSAVTKITSILEQDPTLSARVLRTARSAAFAAAGGQVTTLVEAVNRIGFNGVRTELLEWCTAKVFSSRDQGIAQAAARVWRHSLAVAMLCRDVSVVLGVEDVQGAYLCGLLHDIGKPIVASILLDVERDVTEVRNSRWIGGADWMQIIRLTHRSVGNALAQKWEFPEVLCDCIKDSGEFDPTNRSSIVNVVCFANACVKKMGLAAEDGTTADAEALVMIGRSMLGIDDEILKPALDELPERLKALERPFK